MIATSLSAEIQRFAARMDTDSPFFAAALGGAFTAAAARRYLMSVRHLIRGTVPNLQRARDVARRRGLGSLADYFEQKLSEENGHDRWADRDLATLNGVAPSADTSEVVPAILELRAYLDEIIERDPRLYLSYILFAENLIALRGHEWLDLLESRCGIPKRAMTVIGNHAELDRQHSAEGLEAIASLVTDPLLLAPMRATLAHSMRLFDRFAHEVVGEGVIACRARSAS